ncbi:outer membrane beta-barrel protein [Hymenobacter sp. B81]|uniref:outer membrane beta-barrel protein n=1 Tax=Hymenobacter sp. B81 TaxID=3344878 RepID=UPI0037DDAD9B
MALVSTTHRALLCSGLLLTLLPFGLRAQTPGTISGKLLDHSNQQALPFASVVLLHLPDSALVTGAQTTENGTFRLESVKPGSYVLRATVLGYNPLRRAVALPTGQTELSLGVVALRPTTTQLKGVTVTGERETVQNDLGKRVINVEKDLSTVGGTAVNVLQNVPSVAVDANGTVSLRGSSNLTILIDGKPAGTTNGGPGPRLDQLPASRIAQVEVITNPSAKYDASGAGVINIITKKDRKDGFNGQVGLVVGTGQKYAPTLNLSRRQGPATWNMGYNSRLTRFTSTSEDVQTAVLPSGETVRTSQQGRGRDLDQDHSLRLGLDYELSPQQSLSVSVDGTWEKEQDSDTQLLLQDTAEGRRQQLGTQRVDVDVFVLNASASYRRTWAEQKGRELSADAGWVRVDATVPVTQTLQGGPSQRQEFAVGPNMFFGKIDYEHPLAGGKGKVEAGAKLQFADNTGTGDQLQAPADRPTEFVRNPARALAYDFQELLPAAYFTYQRSLSQGYSLQTGLRAEYTNLHGAVRGGQGRVDLDYLSLFPSATIARDLGEKPGEQRIQASYARRIDRPNFMEQLPFPLYHDPRNYRIGNPALRAEFSHNVELGYQANLKGGAALTGTLFGRFSQDVIQRLRAVDTLATRLGNVGVVTAESYRNFGRTANLGAEATWNQPLTKWWRVAASGSLFRSEVASNADLANNRHALTGTARLTSNFTPRPTLDVQLSGWWRSASLTAQGRQLAVGALEVALRQRLFQDRAALTLRVSDVLNTDKRRSEISTANLDLRAWHKNETRVGWLGFTWYIGATKPGKRIESAPQGGGGFGG